MAFRSDLERVGGRKKNPSVESLIQMSELYGVSVDFLLGLPEARYHRADMLQPIPPEALPAFHDTPVFSSRYGWAMVNAIEGELLFASGSSVAGRCIRSVCSASGLCNTRRGSIHAVEKGRAYRVRLCMGRANLHGRRCGMSFAAGIILKDALRKTRWGSASTLIFTAQNGLPLQTDRGIYE